MFLLLLSVGVQKGVCVKNDNLTDTLKRDVVSVDRTVLSEEKLYRIGSLYNSKRYIGEKGEIDSLADLHRITEEERQLRLIALGREMETCRTLLKKYSSFWASQERKELNDTEQEVYGLLVEGDIENALRVYEKEPVIREIGEARKKIALSEANSIFTLS